ncbi:hypothetical protein PLICRDRAFT_173152 [Plicaturopsis crispa FD-325 SS-3]|nr:hypothetical protein PLICRDRAFT_173152 [Plicaturopsis crispa FD-325 SS-3]
MTEMELVIREVAKDVVTFSMPFSRFGLVPIGGRSTAIKMKDGGVWLLASTPLNDKTKSKLDSMGPVKYICGADAVHHLSLGAFQKAYPDAKVIAPEEALKRADDKDLKLDGAWGRDPEGTKYGFEDDVQHRYFSGYKNKDVAFFHPASKTLIEADLLFNLPCKEQYSKSKESGSIPLFSAFVGLNPSSWLHQKMVKSLGENVESMRCDAKTVANWDFDRIIPCHGDVIENDGKKAWKEAYKFFLD